MALVGMENLGLLVQRLERPDAADAEQDLLAEPVLGAPAVEAVGDGPQLVRVFVDVGVEQVQLDPPDLGHPDLGDEGLPGQVDGDPGPVHRREGHGVGVHHGVALLLPPVGVELLAEIALPVQQADADHRARRGCWPPSGGRRPGSRGRPSTAAGPRRCRTRARSRPLWPAPSARRFWNQRWTLMYRRRSAWISPRNDMKALSLASASSRSRATRDEHLDRVVLSAFPQVGVDPAEDVAGPLVPRPSQVEGQLLKGGQRLGQPGPHGEAPEGFHLRPRYQGRTDVTAHHLGAITSAPVPWRRYRSARPWPSRARPAWPANLGHRFDAPIVSARYPWPSDDRHVRTSANRRPAAGATASKAKRGRDRTPLERIVVQDVRPSRLMAGPAKAVVGELTPVTANIFRRGPRRPGGAGTPAPGQRGGGVLRSRPHRQRRVGGRPGAA